MADISQNVGYLTCVLCLGALSADSVSESRFSPSFEVSSALVNETTLVLDDSDLVIETGDNAINNQVEVGFNSQPGNNFNFASHYTWSDTRYSEFSDFDMILQLFSVSGNYQFDKLSVGVDSFFANAGLNDNSYLKLLQVGPNLGFSVGKPGYVRIAFEYLEREFAQDAEKSTTGPQADLRFYYLLAKTDHFLLANYKGRSEDSPSGLFDRSVHELGLSWVKKSLLRGKRVETSLAVSLEQQTYLKHQSVRKDRLSDIEASGVFWPNEHFYVQVSYLYLLNSSTIDEFDYRQHRAELKLGIKL